MLKRFFKFISLINDPNKDYYSPEQVEQIELNSYFNGDLNKNDNKINFKKWFYSSAIIFFGDDKFYAILLKK